MNLKSLCMFVKEQMYNEFQKISLNDNKCIKTQSLNQGIYWIHNLVLLTLIKGHLILMSRATGSDHKKQKSIKLLQQYNRRVSILKSETRNILHHPLPREIRQLDPKVHVEGITYDRLKYFIQGYLTGEQYLNEFASCSSKCWEYSRTKHHNERGFFIPNSNLICHGTIHNCKESPIQYICEQPHSKRNDRRYVEVNFSKWNTPHCNNKTNQKNRKRIKAFSVVEAGILPWAMNNHEMCELCECYCDYKNTVKSIRSFSLKEVNSNTNENYVITGIRFRIVNQVICLQIQQGKLTNTIIDPETVHWQPVNLPLLKNNNQVVRLNYTIRSLNLDDVEVSRSSIVTGVKVFRNGSMNSSPIWYFPKSNVETRKEININNLNVPTSSLEENEILSKPNEYYVKFTTTSWKTDIAQTVVPFIDLQEVTTDPPSAIGGVGIYHKRQKSDGGFIAPKLLSVNYSSIL
ncbi:hypothetical protein PV327_002838 [Microctonus hyperodae]|uniref:Uncharacterized protein n=1 Tax=Microctonus hyperodae TaxID=165561 RepID=A0AA39KPN1_MICHY|nr:hypothetical protein PV327_002838 [Microctonus hyperodae]